MIKISYAGCLSLSPAISMQFTLKMCVAARNREKLNKKIYFWSSRSFKVIYVDTSKTLSQMLIIISSTSVPICNRIHAGRANSGKIQTF